MNKEFKYIWIGEKPDGSLEVCTFNPVETPNEIATYNNLGWKWRKAEYVEGI